ncbi:MAG: methylase [Solirubrobacterales bacterium]|nr:methylase [Solirubrobacterales bacterium]
MLDAARRRLLTTTPEAARVLDVGGWAKPLPRADAVLDLLPHATRGLYGAEDDTPERFTEATWTQRDICDHEPWPYADEAFDIAVCSHTLEDVRDPVWVCRELSRVAKAGYVEVPAPVQELTWGVHGPWVGWTHHHWITEEETDADARAGLRFTFKPHLLGAPGRHLAAGTSEALPPEERVIAIWWTDTLPAREQVLVGADEFDPWLAGLLDAHGGPAPVSVTGRRHPWRR